LLEPEWSVASLVEEELYFGLVGKAGAAAVEEAGRRLALEAIDDLWADYLANVAELRGGVHWVSWGGRDPLHTFLTSVGEIYADFEQRLEEEIDEGFAAAAIGEGTIRLSETGRIDRGATWTYLTTDQPFGTLGERIVKGLRRKFPQR
jgi:preprotein translocase subunit SecA